MRKIGKAIRLTSILFLIAGIFVLVPEYHGRKTSFDNATAEDGVADGIRKVLKEQETLIVYQVEGTTAYAFVSRTGRTDYGDLFVVFEQEGQEEQKAQEEQEEQEEQEKLAWQGKKGQITWKRVYENDFKELKPWKLELGDVDGDGVTDLLTSVRKTTYYDAAEKNRLFIFEYIDQKLVKKWTGSQIAGVWKDFVVGDLLPSKGEELLFLSQTEGGKEKLGVYSWFDFGFQALAESDSYEDITGLMITGENRMELTYDAWRKKVTLTVKDGRIIQVEP